jgi:hypothetical protein
MGIKDSMTEEINLKEKRQELYDTWQRLFALAEKLLTQAEIDPLAIKASMMAQIVRILSQSGKILDDMEKFQKKVAEEPEIDEETGEEIMSDEEAQLLEDFEKMNAGIGDSSGEYDYKAGSGISGKDEGNKEPTSITDDDLHEGFNYRRT